MQQRLWSVNERFKYEKGYGLVLPGLPRKALLVLSHDGKYSIMSGPVPETAEQVHDDKQFPPEVLLAIEAAQNTAQYIP